MMVNHMPFISVAENTKALIFDALMILSFIFFILLVGDDPKDENEQIRINYGWLISVCMCLVVVFGAMSVFFHFIEMILKKAS